MSEASSGFTISRGPMLRYFRVAIYVACGILIAWGVRGLRLIEVPSGARALFEFVPGQKVLVADLGAEDPLHCGDAVLFFRTRDRLEFGRVVAVGGDTLEQDGVNRRCRKAGESVWYPWPGGEPPVAPGADQVLVLAENPERREIGGIVKRRAIAARLVVALPW